MSALYLNMVVQFGLQLNPLVAYVGVREGHQRTTLPALISGFVSS